MIWSYYFIIIIILLLFATSLSIASSNQLGEAAARDGNGNIGAISKKSCFYKEKQALLHFKASISQDPDGQLSTWIPEDDDCCNWNGVICNNQTGHVTELYLQGYGLEGDISPLLLNLTYLIHLDLSLNSFNGTIPNFIGSMTQLRYLDLRYNHFNGTIPKSIGSLTQLRYLDLSYNFLHGNIPPEFGNLISLQNLSLGTRENTSIIEIVNIDWLSNLSRLQLLEMDRISLAKANYLIDVVLSLPKLSVLSLMRCDLSEVMHPYSSALNSSSSSSSIQYLNLNGNNLNSSMYRWLFPLTSNRLLSLHLSNNMLDGIPKYLGNLCSLTHLYLYSNQIAVKFADFLNNLSGCTSVTLRELGAWNSQFTGSVSDEIQKFSMLESLDLSDNHLSGTMSEKVWELPNLERLYISSNSLVITPNIGKLKLQIIDLSNNSLVVTPSKAHMSNIYHVEFIDMSACNLGPLFPKWIQTYKNLTYLDISGNRISDTIPVFFWKTWPSRLRYLNLSSNNISGKVPDLSSNFDIYPEIYLSSNNFYGLIPNVPSTTVSLNLSKNKFYGGISFLCQIVDGFLTFLDLSHNFLTGKLPDCLWHFKNLQVLNLGHNNLYGKLPASIGYSFQLEVLDLWQGNERELTSTLRFLMSIDLSSNNLTGLVPNELTDLHGLFALNLSKNALLGEIPRKIGEMKNLATLDLSRNHFSGGIPSSMSQMTSLNYLDVSYNKLSGRIPSGTQLQSFERSRYIGNAELCGPPVTKSCPGDEVPPVVRESGEEGKDELERWFYVGGSIGFATGFWMACGALLLNRRGRHAFFPFVDLVKDWVYVKVVVIIRRLERVAGT